MILNRFFFLVLCLQASLAFAQVEHDFLYFKNFVRHADGTLCTHTPPQASFVAYLNNDLRKILLENAPRWESGGDPNITGMGVFGVELGNFIHPAVMVGDSVSFRFTCLAKESAEQGVLSAQITGIPFYYFPTTLYLQPQILPDPPEQLSLLIDPNGYRVLTWNFQANTHYDVYRCDIADTVFQGQSRRLYERIGENIMGGQFCDTSLSTRAHTYVVIPHQSGKYGPHSTEVTDFPDTPQQVEAAVAYANPYRVAITWMMPGMSTDLYFAIYRSQQSGFAIDSLSWIGGNARYVLVGFTGSGGPNLFFIRVRGL